MLYSIPANYGLNVAIEVAQIERTRYQLMLEGKYRKEFKDMIRTKLVALEKTIKEYEDGLIG